MTGSNLNETNTTVSVTGQDIVFATLYSFIVLSGVVGNAIVITIVRKTPSMHTTTNYLLMNLAVADLLTLLFCPGPYDYLLNQFQLSANFGDIACKLFVGNAIVCITFDASALTLCTIAVERYVAIVKPFKQSLIVTPTKAFLVIAVIWILSVVLSLPDSLWTVYNTDPILSLYKYPCIRPWTLNHESEMKDYIIYHCSVLILLPSVFISFCYFSILIVLKWSLTDPAIDDNERNIMKRLLRLLVSLAVAFCITCLPFAGFFLYIAGLDQKRVNERFNSWFLWHRIVRILIFSNSFINPVLYAARNTNYRLALRRLYCQDSNRNEREIEAQAI